MSSLPSLFLAHGAPDLVLSEHPTKHFLKGLGYVLPKPKAILIISAHWEAHQISLGTARMPETVHDFSGFPQTLYSLKYPAATDHALVKRTQALLGEIGLDVGLDANRGYDHGAWMPLSLLYPKADIPVVQLSLQRGGNARLHFNIGQALAPLRDEGVLVIGSGAVVHNLGALAPDGVSTPDWAKKFDRWIDDNIQNRNLEQLLDFPRQPQNAHKAHPSPEHLMPIFVALGAGWQGGNAMRLHHSFSYSAIGMACYGFGRAAEFDTILEKGETPLCQA